MGFDYFYGFMGGETDQWNPYLFRDHSQVFPWVGKPGYNLTTDMADDAIEYMSSSNAAAPDKPFFVYYVPGGTHSPHQPTPEWIEKISDLHLFDKGWNDLREQIFANQKRLGVIPPIRSSPPGRMANPNTAAQAPEVGHAKCRRKEALHPSGGCLCAYVAYTDHEIGRVIQAVEDMGKLDNTLIIYIAATTAPALKAPRSARQTNDRIQRHSGFPVAEQMKAYDAWGSAATYPHMSVAWSWAFDTPFKWTKQVASHSAAPGRAWHCMARPHQGRRRHPHAVPSHD